jgi:hypothetical protein
VLQLLWHEATHPIKATMFRTNEPPRLYVAALEGSNELGDESPKRDDASQADSEVFVQIRGSQDHEK